MPADSALEMLKKLPSKSSMPSRWPWCLQYIFPMLTADWRSRRHSA